MEKPYGSWKSPLTAELVTAASLKFEQIALDGNDIYWTESRPAEGGRSVIVRRTPDGRRTDLTPAPFNVRTRVHEYGGGAYTAVDGTLFFTNFADQHLYRQEPGGEPIAVHTEPGIRHADFSADRERHRLICVREDHNAAGQPVNTLVALATDGSAVQALVSGNDFYASPRVSPDGKRLAWLTWNHPNMPWDGTELWVGEIGADGALGRTELVAGSEHESIFQPEWSPAGMLHFISDRTGWWNLYRWADGDVVPLVRTEAEFGKPQWQFNMATYGFADGDRIICKYTKDGADQLASLDVPSGTLTPIPLPYTHFDQVRAAREFAAVIAGGAGEFSAMVRIDLATGKPEVLRRSVEQTIDRGLVSVARTVQFPTEGGLTAYGYFYQPANRAFTAPAGERPPLIVLSHGGPTGATSAVLHLGIQFWTSRGFAVLDVDYGGSTGYGRAYRERLNGNWGIVDVADCAAGARYLAAQGLVDGSRMAIKGGSAGGYTTLAALAFTDVFQAGVSYYGVSDLKALAEETHKFESRYLDGLVGPYPAAAELYHSRSPIHHTEKLACPVLFLQGLDDKVVLPNQAELMVSALEQKGIPVAYVAFEGEGHGFRKAANQQRALEAELSFYSRIFAFDPADPVPPLAITNL
ncbi:MAG: peptidase (acylaminoacyl-peptidase) family [Firmicutes bacterium]|nr:peptidase (acylaminoacyl-peptidase) family [Bacillota bacterium]